jgi:hypothetical protein
MDATKDVTTVIFLRLSPAGQEVRRVLPDVGTGKDWNEMLKYRLGLT